MKKRKIEILAVLSLAGVISFTSTYSYIASADNLEIEKGDMTISIPEDMLVANVKSFLNVRLEPKSASPIIAELTVGQSVEVVEYLDKWVKVKVDEQEGYVFTDYTVSGDDLGTYVSNNLQLFKKTTRQQDSSFRGVYESKKAASDDAIEYNMTGVVNNTTAEYVTSSTDEIIEDEYEDVKKCLVLDEGDGLRIRSKANKKKGEVIGGVAKGTYMEFLAYEGPDWIKVKWKGQVGYVAREFVKVCTIKEPASNIKDTLEKETKVSVIKITPNWVVTEDEDGNKGYIERKYVDVTAEATNKIKKFVGFMENNVSYEVISVFEDDRVAEIALPDGTTGFTKLDNLMMEILIDPPEVDYSVIPEEDEVQDSSNVKFKDIEVGATREEMVEFALQFLGNPYVWGGTSLTKGADCSGFTQQIYKHAGISISRCSFEQVNDGKEIEFEDLKKGDLIFYWNKEAGRIGHVAMYIGNGKVVHASSPKYGIKISKWNYRKPYKAANIIGD